MYIYKTTNLKNGKIYIGLSEKSPDDSKEYLGSGDYFKRALSKYGRSSFNKEILEESIETRKDLALSEIKWITYYNSTDRKIGYNISPGGDLNPEFMKKEIYQYSRSGDLVKIHLTIDDAKKTVGSKNSDLYKKAIRESRPILGFWWSLSELTKEFVLELDKKYTTNKKKSFKYRNTKHFGCIFCYSNITTSNKARKSKDKCKDKGRRNHPIL